MMFGGVVGLAGAVLCCALAAAGTAAAMALATEVFRNERRLSE